MRRLALLTALVIVGARVDSLSGAEPIRWLPTVEEASSEARKTDRPIMLDFWADWCAPCRVMEANVYSDASVREAASRFVAVRIDFDKKPALARKYDVIGLPTIVFTDSRGTELFRHAGAIGAKPLVELLRALPHDVREFNRLSDVLARDKRDIDALAGMGKALRAAGLYLASNLYYRRLLSEGKGRLQDGQRAAILEEMAGNALDLEDGTTAADIIRTCLKEYPSSPRTGTWMSQLARARALMDKR